MNTLPWLVTLIASLWFAVYSFGTLGENALGFIGLGLFLFCIPQIILAVQDDIEILKGRKE